MRFLFLTLLTLSTLALHAQLRTGGGAGAKVLELPALPFPDLLRTGGPARLDDRSDELRASTFNFAEAKPHLAFFCRLELNIEEATHFPVRFRLGEVRTWQQELTKRD